MISVDNKVVTEVMMETISAAPVLPYPATSLPPPRLTLLPMANATTAALRVLRRLALDNVDATSAVGRGWPGRFTPAVPQAWGKRRCLHAPGIGRGPDKQQVLGEETEPFANRPMSFPCLDALETKTELLKGRSVSSGPEPVYTTGPHLSFRSRSPLLLDWGGVLPEYDVAYETWGTLNDDRSNAIVLHTGLSASSHAHSTEINPKPGWWERFIGSGCPLDTDKYYIICTNVIGGCYGSTGPGSTDPANGTPYATRFPVLTLHDMVRAQFGLLDDLGIDRLYASVGASMGGMQSLAAAVLSPDRVGKVVSISGCARSHPYSIAMRHTQRQGSSTCCSSDVRSIEPGLTREWQFS